MPSRRFHVTQGPVRWLVIPVIAVDTACTLLGQPASYWKQPFSCNEGNPFFEWFLQRGCSFFLITSAFYILLAFLLSSYLPQKLAKVVLLSYILGHFFGASTWLCDYFKFGMSGPILYGILIAIAFTLLDSLKRVT
jgi:hypothetical protein